MPIASPRCGLRCPRRPGASFRRNSDRPNGRRRKSTGWAQLAIPTANAGSRHPAEPLPGAAAASTGSAAAAAARPEPGKMAARCPRGTTHAQRCHAGSGSVRGSGGSGRCPRRRSAAEAAGAGTGAAPTMWRLLLVLAWLGRALPAGEAAAFRRWQPRWALGAGWRVRGLSGPGGARPQRGADFSLPAQGR